MIYVYALSDPRTNVVRYIGKTKSPKRRLWGHCSPHKRDRTHRTNWLISLKNAGLKPQMEILEETNADDVASMMEAFWVASLRAAGAQLVNYSAGGERIAEKTPRWFAAIRKANSRPRSPEHAEKIAAQLRGKKVDPELAERRTKHLRGKKRAPSVGVKISAAKKGVSNPAIVAAATKARLALAEKRAQLPLDTTPEIVKRYVRTKRSLDSLREVMSFEEREEADRRLTSIRK